MAGVLGSSDSEMLGSVDVEALCLSAAFSGSRSGRETESLVCRGSLEYDTNDVKAERAGVLRRWRCGGTWSWVAECVPCVWVSRGERTG